ncbi:MAG: thiol:disulfide interchange protein DsbA/DsbL [Burkholderiaceae bacterium]
MQTIQLNRRTWLQAAAAGCAWPMAQAWAQPFQEGSDYVKLSQAVAPSVEPGQVLVLEFFAYTCIHCYRLEAALTRWAKQQPSSVVVQRVPVQFAPAMLGLQKLYYTLEGMDALDTLHPRVFVAIHEQRQRLLSDAAIKRWVQAQGVDMTRFNDLYDSFGVAGKATRAVQLTNSYQVEGTPALGVGGRYLVPGQGERTLQIANQLITQLRGV